MPTEQFTVSSISIKEITRIFSRIHFDQTQQYNNTPCWVWLGTVCAGYARITWKNNGVAVHRLIYAWTVGPLPCGPASENGKRLELDHLCRNQLCCNPVHLELVSRKINVLRGTSFAAEFAKRIACKRGHDLTCLENIYTSPNGDRSCRLCRRVIALEYYYQRKAERGSVFLAERAAQQARYVKARKLKSS